MMRRAILSGLGIAFVSSGACSKPDSAADTGAAALPAATTQSAATPQPLAEVDPAEGRVRTVYDAPLDGGSAVVTGTIPS